MFGLVLAKESWYQSNMKFLPSKESMATWEFILTVVITLIIAAELYFAWAGFYEAQDQYQVLKDLKTASREQAATLKTLTDEQSKSLESLTRMNEALQTSVSNARDMASALRRQLKILEDEQNERQAQAAKKPKLEVQVGGVDVNTFFSIPIKSKEETDTSFSYNVKLLNNGEDAARHGVLRVIVNAKDVSIQSSSPFQKPYEEPDSAMHAILLNFDVVRSHGNIGFDITLNYPKGQAPFTVMFNADADELPTATSLGAMTVKPRKPSP